MLLKSITTLGLMTFISASSLALPLMQIQNEKQIKISSAKAAVEKKLGQSLNAQQILALKQFAEMDKETTNNVDYVDFKEASKSIYCVGGGLGAVETVSMAICVHLWSGTVYSVGLLGGGATLQMTGNAFYLTVTYDSSRYDSSFDPIPGNYGAITQSLTFGLGLSAISASSGNKRITGSGITNGIGADLATISLLQIEPIF